jgi:hypothetical protein
VPLRRDSPSGCPCLAGLCIASRLLPLSRAGSFRLRALRLDLGRSHRGCRPVLRHPRSGTSLCWSRRLDHRLVVRRPLRVGRGVTGRCRPWPRSGACRVPCVGGPDRTLRAQLPRGIVLGQPAALRVRPGIHFVLPAHMRNLSNAPTPPTSASSDASSMNVMRADVC